MIVYRSKVFRLFRHVLVVCCVLQLSTALAFAETKFTTWGDIDVSLSVTEGADFKANSSRDNFAPRQRVRLWLKAQTSEDLAAWVMFRMATGNWGMTSAGGKPIGYNLDADQVNLRTRFLFLNWTPASSPWSGLMGIIPASIPYASFHSGVLDTSAAGIDIGYKFNDTVKANLAWFRPFDEYSADSQATGNTAGNNLHDEMDMFMVKLPITLKEPNLSITPWGLYSVIGKDSGFWKYAGKGTPMKENGDAFWGGIALKSELTDDLLFKYDVLYGNLTTNHDAGNYNSRGWQTSAALDYKQPWGTPGLFGWYATGSDADKIQRDGQWGSIPSISVFDFGFNPTSFGFKDALGINEDGFMSWKAGGRWGIGAQVKDITFIDNLSHTVRLAYYRGTNENNLAGLPNTDHGNITVMTKGDAAIEANLIHDWKIEEHVSLYVNMGYINLDRGDAWKNDRNASDAWQLGANLRYRF